MFIDKVKITIKAGNGGNGCTSFYRDTRTMKGGPDGGDGGRGGDIVFYGSTRVDNLIDFRFTKKFEAENGGNGMTTMKNGKGGKDKEIAVPLGTKIYKADGSLVADITTDGQQFVALRGGGGGAGNAHFATARRKTPNFHHTGIKTEMYEVTLEMECIADVGIIGFPNVGKSSFLSLVTRANPKIGNYPFTTLHPNIGVYSNNGKTIVLADIPGLIEGAAEGVGLGTDFLKHINRTRLLVHVVDASESDGRDAISDYHIINRELSNFSENIIDKPQIVVLNKIDAVDPERFNQIKSEFKKLVDSKVFEISVAARLGIDELLEHIVTEVDKIEKPKQSFIEGVLENIVDKNEFHVDVDDYGLFHVTGPMVDNLIRGVVLTDTESRAYFHRRLQKSGVVDALRELGLCDGDEVQIANMRFEWWD